MKAQLKKVMMILNQTTLTRPLWGKCYRRLDNELIPHVSHFTMDNYLASLTYVCFVPAQGLIRDLSANSSNIAFEVPLASKLME